MARLPTGATPADDVDAICLRLSELRTNRLRQCAAHRLSTKLLPQLNLDRRWRPRQPASRDGMAGLKVFMSAIVCRIIDLGSEWRQHRLWHDHNAMADLLRAYRALSDTKVLYCCLDGVVGHKGKSFWCHAGTGTI